MNKLRQIPFETLAILLCFISIGAYGQGQRKTFTENFPVSKDAILDINTSHADIEFKTWAKDQIEIEAIIELQGATNEEADRYFEDSSFEILKNNKKVTIATGRENTSFWQHPLSDVQNFHIEMPEFPDIESFDFDFDFEELSNMPIPPIPPMAEFDHKAFKKDGEKYLKNWQKEFKESYDEDHIKKLEEWAKRMEEKQEKMEKKREEMTEKREEMMEKRDEKRRELQEKMMEVRVKRLESQQERREQLMERKAEVHNGNRSPRVVVINGDSISTITNGGPNVFYRSSNGLNKNYKVKKTIKIKMPKGMKIKMNVRHGEVKLADNIWHMDAQLSHSSLWAASIDGDRTTIKASYSPVSVDKWYLGNLDANYSESINLKEVFNIKLNTTSSNVTIDKLIKTAFIKNDFGQLKIGAITKDCTILDVTLQNAELDFNVPNIAFDIYVNGTSSKFTCPEKITFELTKNHTNKIYKGYFKSKSSGRSITVNSKYSDVVLN